jgi:hypothetical protein
MPPKHSRSVKNKKSSSSAFSEDAPTIEPILDCLTMDTKNLTSAVSTANTQLDTKVTSVSTLLETLQNDVTGNLQSLRSDVSTRFDAVYLNVDNTIMSACSEWCSDLDTSLTSTCSEWCSDLDTSLTLLHFEWHSATADINHSFESRLKVTSLHFGTIVNDILDKISTLEYLSILDPQVLHLLSEATLEHIHNLTLSPAIVESSLGL